MYNIIQHQNTELFAINKSTALFLESIHNRLSPATLKTYTTHIQDFKQWFISTPVTIDLPNHLQAYRSHLVQRYNSAKSINLALSSVRSLYKFLYETGIIETDPTKHLKNIKENQGVRRSALSREQIAVILHKLNTSEKRFAKRDKTIFLLLVMNGLRVSELCNLKIEDIDLHQGARVAYLLRKGYTDKTAYVKLQDKTYQVILDLIGDKTEGHVFISDRTQDKLHSDSVSRIVKKIFRDCGYDSSKLTCHSLRHTYAILSLEGGASLISLMNSMNHRAVSTTAHYLHSYDRINNSAEDAVTLDFDA